MSSMSRAVHDAASTTGAMSRADASRELSERLGERTVVPVGDGPALVARGDHVGVERDPAHHGDPYLGRQPVAAALAEQRVPLAVLALEGGHVLYHSGHTHVRTPEHVGGPPGDLLCCDRGVVTTSTSARGSILARPMGTSPVPGGMSISR